MKNRILICGAAVVILISIALAVTGEFQTLVAWWLTIILLLPAMLWALKTEYTTLITISLLAFTTQFITLPVVYINRADFSWGHVKPYHFSSLEALPMLIKITFFLMLLILFFKTFYKVAFIGGSPKKIASLRQKFSPITSTDRGIHLTLNKHSLCIFYTFILIAVVAALIPLNIWMFSQGISIVGIEPPPLPFRISGILHYFTKYAATLIVIYIYYNTKRNWFPMALVMSYAFISSFSSVSRSTLMYLMLPVIVFSWIDRRNIMLIIANAATLIGFSLVTVARDFVYYIDAGKTGGNFDTGVVEIILNSIDNIDSDIFGTKEVLFFISQIFDRIEGFHNLIMSQYYDSYQVTSPISFITNMMWHELAPMNLDLHHIQWQGNILPDGFVNGGGLLSTVVILGNAGWWWIALFAIVAAMTFVILEKSIRRLVAKYQLKNILASGIVSFLSISYFIGAGGSAIFMYPFVFLFVMSYLPPLTHSKLRLQEIALTASPAAPINVK